jgi:uncharacterized protein YndB with AHSA1/START domain
MSAETSSTSIELGSADSTSLRLERTYDATAEEVFDAWTNPDVLRRWWVVQETWRTPVADVDLRPGGRYRLSMEDPASGVVRTVGGEYLEVLRPERLVYTWQWEAQSDMEAQPDAEAQPCEEGQPDAEAQAHEEGQPDAEAQAHEEGQSGEIAHVSTVTVRFIGDGKRTTVVLEHSGLESSQSRDRHGHGWNACLESLQKRVFATV